MELSDLRKFNDYNELDLLYELITISNANKKDAERILRGEKEAGVRMRNSMQDVKLLCEIIRDKIQIRKKASWGDKRISALDKAITKAQKKAIKETQNTERKKQERIARLTK